MSQRRLPWLLAVLGALTVVRLLAPPASSLPPPLAEAVVRQPRSQPAAAAMPAPASRTAVHIAMQPDAEDLPGNAFAVRPPPLPAYVPPVTPSAVAQLNARFINPPVAPVTSSEPPLPAVPFQVIGSWDDGKNPGIFLASPSGTLLARPGEILQAEYRVTAVTPQQIVLMHTPTKREIRLGVPFVPNTPPLP